VDPGKVKGARGQKVKKSKGQEVKGAKGQRGKRSRGQEVKGSKGQREITEMRGIIKIDQRYFLLTPIVLLTY
jgi:hypothetical protein